MSSKGFYKDKSRRIAELRAMIEATRSQGPVSATRARSRELLERLISILEGKG